MFDWLILMLMVGYIKEVSHFFMMSCWERDVFPPCTGICPVPPMDLIEISPNHIAPQNLVNTFSIHIKNYPV
ncbi:hypothetical protein DVK01_18965 [Haloarcula sp. Atlit-120R]|nr:hypothetical protein DVK01_18965 [Haloarcula sp. Atlit-120R]